MEGLPRTSVGGWQREPPPPLSAAAPRLLSAAGAAAAPLQPCHCRLQRTVAATRRGRHPPPSAPLSAVENTLKCAISDPPNPRAEAQ
eukprot:352131-Chlamydomonas_euryale.AAC.2